MKSILKVQPAALVALLAGSLAFAAYHYGARLLPRAGKGNSRPALVAKNGQPLAATVPPAYSLAPVQTIPVPASHVAIADMTGDGKNDLLLFVQSPVPEPVMLLYPQLPGGVLGQPQRLPLPRSLYLNYFLAFMPADMNEDGRSDLVVSLKFGGLAMLLSQPNGEFAWQTDGFDPRTARRMAIDDFNGDGHKDVLVHGERPNPQPYTASFAAYYGDGKGGFPTHAIIPTGEDEGYALVSGDYDGDGDADVASYTRNGPGHGLVLRRNGGSQGLQLPGIHYGKMAEGFDRIAIADVNGDGRKDLVAHNYGQDPRNEILTFLQNQDGTLQASPSRAMSVSGYPVEVATLLTPDLNNDGRADIVYQYRSWGEFYYMLSKPDRLGDPVTIIPQFGQGSITAGDLNSDGLVDLVIGGNLYGVSILRGTLTPYAGAATPPGAPLNVSATLDPYSLNHDQASESRVNVGFSAPTSNGGAPITGYRVYSIPGGAYDVDAGTTSLTHRVMRLANNTDYRFFVVATNSAGEGSSSANSSLVQVRDTPYVRIEEWPYAYEGNTAKVKLILEYPALSGGASLQMTTSDQTAIAGSDYVQTTSWVTIPEGQTEGFFEVQTIDDQAQEPGKYFMVTITGAVGADVRVDRNTRWVAVADDESIVPTYRVHAHHVFVTEGDAGSKTGTITLFVENPLPVDVSFDLALVGGTATPGVDYAPFGPVHGVIPAGQKSVSFDVSVIGDLEDEDREETTIALSNLVNADYPWPATFYIDDNELPTIALSPIQVVEGSSGTKLARMTASLSRRYEAQVQFDALTVDGSGSAVPGEDYLARVFPALAIPAYETSTSFDIPINGDGKYESDESFNVGLANVIGAKAGPPGVITIANDDSPGMLSIADITVDEGDSGVRNAKFTVTLSQAQAQPVSFDFYAAPGTAAPGADFADVSLANLSIPAGQTSVVVPVPIYGDILVEKNETFTGNLNNVVGAAVANYQGRATILDDELPDLWIEDLQVVEGNEGLSTAYFDVRLSRAVDFPVQFDIASDMMGPTYYVDYQADYKGKVFDPGRTLVRYEVRIVGDTLVEGHESFNIFVFNVQNANVVDNLGVGTIVDDDQAATGPGLDAIRRGRTITAEQSAAARSP